jgi:hypothetical protein
MLHLEDRKTYLFACTVAATEAHADLVNCAYQRVAKLRVVFG